MRAVVRTVNAGVFAGELPTNFKEIPATLKVKNARRLWYWSGAASLSQLAKEGVKNPAGCKFPCAVNYIFLTNVIEVIPMTAAASKNIDAVPEWKV